MPEKGTETDEDMNEGKRKGGRRALAIGIGVLVFLVACIVGCIVFVANPPQGYRAESPKYVELYFTAERNRQLTELAAGLLAQPAEAGAREKAQKTLLDRHGLRVMTVDKDRHLVQLGYFQLRTWHLYFYGTNEKFLREERRYKDIRKLDNNWFYVRW